MWAHDHATTMNGHQAEFHLASARKVEQKTEDALWCAGEERRGEERRWHNCTHLEDEVVIRLNNAAAPWAAEAVGVAAFELVDDRAIASNDAAAVGRRAAVLGHGSQSTFTPCSDVLVRLAALEERFGAT